MAVNFEIMNPKRTILILFVLASFAAGLALGILSSPGNVRMPEVSTVSDTLLVRDTIIYERPVSVAVRVTDTLYIQVRDTVVRHDTAFVRIPMEQKVYEDSTYRAVISGYRPSLDSICIFPETRLINTTQTISVPSRKRWGIGVQAGYGAHVHGGRIYASPYVGVGISYNLIRW